MQSDRTFLFATHTLFVTLTPSIRVKRTHWIQLFSMLTHVFVCPPPEKKDDDCVYEVTLPPEEDGVMEGDEQQQRDGGEEEMEEEEEGEKEKKEVPSAVVTVFHFIMKQSYICALIAMMVSD